MSEQFSRRMRANTILFDLEIEGLNRAIDKLAAQLDRIIAKREGWVTK